MKPMRKNRRKQMAWGIAWVGTVLFTAPFLLNLWTIHTTKDLVPRWQQFIADQSEENRKQWQEVQKTYNVERDVENADNVVDPFSQHAIAMENPFVGFGTDDPIGVLEIPSLDLRMPLYLSATEGHLQEGAAVVDGTSLPLGGLGTRSVIAGHRGWYDAPYFRDLDALVKGDRILLHVLDQTLLYTVENQEVITPQETEKLAVDPQKDALTLLTCTPRHLYTHRLLVNAVRIEENTQGLAETTTTAEENQSHRSSSTGEAVHGSIYWQWALYALCAFAGSAASFYVAYRWVRSFFKHPADSERSKAMKDSPLKGDGDGEQ